MSVKRADTDRPAEGADAKRAARGPGEILTLSLDTASPMRSVAVLRGQAVLGIVRGEQRERGTASVLRDVDEAMGRAGVSLREIDLYAAADGPGSFTGLRSGLATIKAFAATLGRPAIGVHTLHAIAHAVGPAERIMALLPAGRGEFFMQLLSLSADEEVVEHGPAAHASPEKVIGEALGLEGAIVWAGEGAHVLAEKMRAGEIPLAKGFDFITLEQVESGREWVLAPKSDALATHVARLAQRSYFRGGHGPAQEVRAFYVRASDAELKERCQPQESPEKRFSGSGSN